MKSFKDKVAVVTGAASGIGRGFAERCQAQGMKVVLADVEQAALDKVYQELKARGGEHLAVKTDVSKYSEVEALAQQTREAFGAVHLLFNNAGVSLYGRIWEASLKDWEWMLGINLWGVIHGIRAFVPGMLEQAGEGHIVNTASMLGLASPLPFGGVYSTTKHAVVVLSESLHKDLLAVQSRLKVSVLCPAAVKTRIMDSERNRDEGTKSLEALPARPELAVIAEHMRKSLESGMAPEKVAEHVFAAIEEERFYVLTHPDQHLVRDRMEKIIKGLDPMARL